MHALFITGERNTSADSVKSSLGTARPVRKTTASSSIKVIFFSFIKSEIENFRKRTLMDEMQENDEDDISGT